MQRKRIDARQLDLETKVVNIRRVTKVVKGGRNFRFAALVVVGDGNEQEKQGKFRKQTAKLKKMQRKI